MMGPPYGVMQLGPSYRIRNIFLMKGGVVLSKILVVDDEAKACELLRRFLEAKGYEVITSNNGKDAIEKVRNEKPNVMLLDIKMPGIGGTEVLKRVREFDKNIGIIMVTAIKEEETGIEALKSGADEYITKPIDFNYLETSILVDLVMRGK
jgi:DNA-binding response OmpR family regulator